MSDGYRLHVLTIYSIVTAQTPEPPNVEDAVDELSKLTSDDWITALVIMLIALAIAFALRTIIVKGLRRRSGALVAKLLGRLVIGIVLAIGMVYALLQVGVSIGPILGMLGLLGLAMALALQDVLSSLVAGTMLAFQRPFRDGDQIRTADFEGTVEDVTLRAVTMRTFDGVRVFIPNLTVWEEPIVNYTTLGTRRTALVVGVGYESDLDAVQELLVTSVASRDGVLADPAPEAFVKEFGDSSVNFLVLFWHGPHIAEEWRARDAVMRGIKRDFDAAGIEIPLPQRVMSFKDPESADDELLPGKGEPGHASDGHTGR